MSHTATALILDGEYKSALAAIRSLGRKDVRVVCGAERGVAMGRYSRYVSERFVYPSPVGAPEQFLGVIRDVVARETGAGRPVIVYTFTDSSTLAIMRSGQEFGDGMRYVGPELDALERSFDKGETVELALHAGIKTPRTFFPRNAAEARALSTGKHISYPLVLKPRHNVAWPQGAHAGVRAGVEIVFSAEELASKWKRTYEGTREPPIVQEFIKGGEYGFVAMCRAGQMLASCAYRRIRSMSPSGGASVVRETVHKHELGLHGIAERLVAELRWTGPIMVEFKMDERDGKPALIEINGRFWGSLPLGLHVGVDFPYMYYQLGCREQVQAPPSYDTGVASRHFLGDVKNLLSVLFKKTPLRPLLYPSRARAMKDFLFSGAVNGDIVALDDMKPVVVEPLQVLLKLVSQRRARS